MSCSKNLFPSIRPSVTILSALKMCPSHRFLLNTILERKTAWTHFERRESCERNDLKTDGRGKPHTMFLNDIKTNETYKMTKRIALDRKSWRNWMPRTCFRAENQWWSLKKLWIYGFLHFASIIYTFFFANLETTKKKSNFYAARTNFQDKILWTQKNDFCCDRWESFKKFLFNMRLKIVRTTNVYRIEFSTIWL